MDMVNYSLKTFLKNDLSVNGANIAKGEEDYVNRVLNHDIDAGIFKEFKDNLQYLGVTQNFKEIIDYFKIPAGETPPGFRI